MMLKFVYLVFLLKGNNRGYTQTMIITIGFQ